MRGIAIAVAAAALFTGIVLLAFSPSSPARGPSDETRRSRTLRRAESMLARLDRAIEQRNAGRLRAMLHRDFIAVGEDGAIVDRDAFVTARTSGSLGGRHQIEQVRGGRRTIVAVGRMTAAEPAGVQTGGGEAERAEASEDDAASATRRFTAVLVRVGEDWEITALHTSLLPAAARAAARSAP